MKTFLSSFFFLIAHLTVQIQSTSKFTTSIKSTSTSTKVTSTSSTSGAPTPSTTYQDASFDDLASTPLGIAPALNKVPTPYHNLYFRGFGVSALVFPNSLLAPHSPNNVAGSGPANQVTNGGGPAFLVTYPGSTVKSCDLKSVYIGCVALLEGAAFVPVGCTFQFTGKTTAGATVSALVNFAPNTLLGGGGLSTGVTANMTQGVFPSTFVDLVEVDVAVVDSTVAMNVTVPLIDDLVFYTR